MLDRLGRGVATWYFRVLHTLAASAMLVIVVVMAVQVFFRYVLNDSLIWAEELSRYILIWISFLFVGVAFHRGEFIAIDILGRLLPAAWQFALKVAVTLPALVFLWLMVINGYLYASRFSMQTLPAFDFIWMSLTAGRTLGVSIFWIYISVSVGSALLIIHMLLALFFEGATLFARSMRPAAAASDR